MDDEEAPYLMKEFHEHLGKRVSEKISKSASVLVCDCMCVYVPRLSLLV